MPYFLQKKFNAFEKTLFVQRMKLHLFIFCCLFLFLKPGGAQPQEAFLISSHKASFNVFLKKLVMRAGETELIMQAIPETDLTIYLYPPGDPKSIVLHTFEKDYELRDAIGIPYFPDVLEVDAGDTATFSLFYDKLPEDITEIDIIERVEPFSDGFSFFNVKLSREPDKFKSLRFRNVEGFKSYFLSNKRKQAMEGFWEVEKELMTVFKKKKWKPILEKRKDTVAVVFEDNLLRAYYLDGSDYKIEFKAMGDYLSLNSDLFAEDSIILTREPNGGIKLKAVLKKKKIKPKYSKKARKAKQTIKLIWQKKSL